MKAKGGCLCGEIRYSINADIVDAGYCHCTICQRASGAPFLVWLTIPYSGFQITQGQVKYFSSSEKAHRGLCSNCGTQLTFCLKQQVKTIDVTLCSLDKAEWVKPEYHIWYKSKVAWFEINDDLPKYMDAGMDE